MLRRKTRVLFLHDTARNGGPGRSLHAILRFVDPDAVHRAVVLPRPGVVSDLLTGARGGARVVDELYFAPNMVENPVEPWGRAIARADFDAPLAVRGVRFAGNLARGALAIAEVARTVRRGRYDLIYCNGTNANFGGGVVAALTGVPALWHVRYTSLPRVVRDAHDRLAASGGVARILCVSRASASLFSRVGDKVLVLHNGIDLEAFDGTRIARTLRVELGLSPDTVVFGSHGRVLRRKGYVEMIRAARVVLDAMDPAERARTTFVVIGDTPQDIRPDHVAECRVLVHELGLDGRVHFLGFRRDVRPLVADFDVAVVASVYPDPLPRAVLESMALGKPVVAFDVGGVAEMLVDGETGALVRGAPPSVPDLAAAMLAYARDPARRARHGTAARARAARTFDGRAQARKIEAEIARAAAGAPS